MQTFADYRLHGEWRQKSNSSGNDTIFIPSSPCRSKAQRALPDSRGRLGIPTRNCLINPVTESSSENSPPRDFQVLSRCSPFSSHPLARLGGCFYWQSALKQTSVTRYVGGNGSGDRNPFLQWNHARRTLRSRRCPVWVFSLVSWSLSRPWAPSDDQRGFLPLPYSLQSPSRPRLRRKAQLLPDSCDVGDRSGLAVIAVAITV